MVGENFLSAFFSTLVERLASNELLNFARHEGVDAKLVKWGRTLLKIQLLLDDAEDKQMTDRAVKLWLDDLQDLAYDLDDILDELATERLRRQASSSEMPKFQKGMFNINMGIKIDRISDRLQEISEQTFVLGLKSKESVGWTLADKKRKRLASTSLVDEVHVYGREEDKDAILELLLRVEGSGDEICVIPILGMGGLGKTTVAQLVYNDFRVCSSFELRAWVCAAYEFDIVALTKGILESLTSKPSPLDNLNVLQVKLKELLSGKKFLLVLDDIWNESYDLWDALCRPFLAGAPGSKIIVTTRNRSVASIVSTVPPYHLKQLGTDDSLSLFVHHALGRRNFDAHPHLKEIGEEIVKQCQGLPLAIKTLGGLLRTKLCQTDWEDILNSKIWDLPEQQSDILPALRLSYYHLPSHLKPCFAYCAIFPKDYKFHKDDLVLLWMAVGLLKQSKTGMRIEDFGHKFFDDLLSRSFFQQSSGSGSLFVMHDLINDLAQSVAGEICFRLEDNSAGINEQQRISGRARHLSYIRQEFDVFRRFKDLYNAPRLQTFLPVHFHKVEYPMQQHLSSKVLLDLLPKFTCLRVLSLSHYSMTELPNSIGDLTHLRYLDLSHTAIKYLPESVCTLYNLQTLILRGCECLCMLPASIGNLISLRHLDNSDTWQLRYMPSEIGKLTSLQTLSKIVLAKGSGLRLKYLSGLMLLRGTLSIVHLQHVMDIRDAKEAKLRYKKDLDELELNWSSQSDDSLDKECMLDVLDTLQPHQNLKSLKIKNYGGIRFPRWIGDPSFSKVVKISLNSCPDCTALPSLGQLPMLKHLQIGNMVQVRSVGIEFYGDCWRLEFPFPSLETLTFEDMAQWEEWSSSTDSGGFAGLFPRLHELNITNCPKLTRVSRLRLPCLRKLELVGCSGKVLQGFADLTSLTTLDIHNVMQLNCLPEEFLRFSVALEDLTVQYCPHLETLWQSGVTLESLVRLKDLIVWGCPKLISLGEEEQGLPRTLEVLMLRGCDNLEKLPNGLNKLMCLRELKIHFCPKLMSFTEMVLSPMLRLLDIQGCKALESLPTVGISHLEELCIIGCSSLRSWPVGKLPTTLKKLVVKDCGNLESGMLQDSSSISLLENLSIGNWPYFRNVVGSVHNFASLVELYVDGLDSFPESGLPTNLSKLCISDCNSLGPLPTNLRILKIWNSCNLKSLPDGIQSLASLMYLDITSCRILESFPNTDLPPNLTSLEINRCEKLKPLSEWGLHRLLSLRSFKIEGGYPELVSFSDNDDNECLLPANLISFEIKGLPNLESLSKGLQNLTSLEHLIITNCPKLQSLPKEDMLATLSCLNIIGSPLLKQQYLKDEGEYWPKIASIPFVKIS